MPLDVGPGSHCTLGGSWSLVYATAPTGGHPQPHSMTSVESPQSFPAGQSGTPSRRRPRIRPPTRQELIHVVNGPAREALLHRRRSRRDRLMPRSLLRRRSGRTGLAYALATLLVTGDGALGTPREMLVFALTLPVLGGRRQAPRSVRARPERGPTTPPPTTWSGSSTSSPRACCSCSSPPAWPGGQPLGRRPDRLLGAGDLRPAGRADDRPGGVQAQRGLRAERDHRRRRRGRPAYRPQAHQAPRIRRQRRGVRRPRAPGAPLDLPEHFTILGPPEQPPGSRAASRRGAGGDRVLARVRGSELLSARPPAQRAAGADRSCAPAVRARRAPRQRLRRGGHPAAGTDRDARGARRAHALKRAIDVVGAAAGLLLLAPLAAPTIALRIRLDSPGPVLFRQTRLGMEMREFTFLKFRTMKVETDAVGPPRLHPGHDERLGGAERERSVQARPRRCDHPRGAVAAAHEPRRAPAAGQRPARRHVAGRAAARVSRTRSRTSSATTSSASRCRRA